MGTSTPWGTSDHNKKIARGIVFYGTPSHGGYHLSPTRNEQVHPALRLNNGGWYEEDCAWAIVALTFPEHFTVDDRLQAKTSLKNYLPDEYTAATGEIVIPEESKTLRERAAREAAKDSYVSVAAWGSWHEKVPAGMVGVVAVRGGRLADGSMASKDEKYFLVPDAEYNARGPIGFVMGDGSKYQECSKIV